MDYNGSNQVVMFGDGMNTAMVTISLNPDLVYEGESEQFTVRLRPTGAGLVTLTSPDDATVTIIEDDCKLFIVINT